MEFLSDPEVAVGVEVVCGESDDPLKGPSVSTVPGVVDERSEIDTRAESTDIATEESELEPPRLPEIVLAGRLGTGDLDSNGGSAYVVADSAIREISAEEASSVNEGGPFDDALAG